MTMHRDFKELISLFNEEKVEFLLVGAHALALHGHPRFTGDMDLWVHASKANAKRVFTALARYGAPLNQTQASEFSKPGLVLQIGLPPMRIDILTSLTGLSWPGAWKRRCTTSLAGVDVSFLSVQDMITNKRAIGRHKDLADVELLEAKPRHTRQPSGASHDRRA
jgi:hypothetical protein